MKKEINKGSRISWIVLAEWVYEGNNYSIKAVKAVKVDGKKIKANTFYKLKNSEFVESIKP